jgi:hypothetical protein
VTYSEGANLMFCLLPHADTLFELCVSRNVTQAVR